MTMTIEEERADVIGILASVSIANGLQALADMPIRFDAFVSTWVRCRPIPGLKGEWVPPLDPSWCPTWSEAEDYAS